MSGIRLKYVHQWVDKRDGGAKARYYFRRFGKRIALSGLPGSAEFMAAYQLALTDQVPRPPIGASRTKPGSISALIVTYFGSPQFLSLKSATQQTYRLILQKFRAKHGDKSVALLTRKHVNAMLAQRVETPAAANHWLRLMKMLMAFAVAEGWRKDDPSIGIERLKTRSEGFHTWTEGEITAFEAHHPTRRGWRSRSCSTRRSVAPMSCAWDVSTFAAMWCMCASRRPAPCWRSHCTPILARSSRHRGASPCPTWSPPMASRSPPPGSAAGSASAAMKPACRGNAPPMGCARPPAGVWPRPAAAPT